MLPGLEPWKNIDKLTQFSEMAAKANENVNSKTPT